jgi:chromosome segregation ATPase
MPACCDNCEPLYNQVLKWQAAFNNAQTQLQQAQNSRDQADAAVASDQQQLDNEEKKRNQAQAKVDQYKAYLANDPSNQNVQMQLTAEEGLLRDEDARLQSLRSKLARDQNDLQFWNGQIAFWQAQAQYYSQQLGYAMLQYSMCCHFHALGFGDPAGAAEGYYPIPPIAPPSHPAGK